MATLAVTQMVVGGIAPVYDEDSAGSSVTHADADTHDFPNDGRTFMLVKNGITAGEISIAISGNPPGQAASSVSVSVPASVERVIGPFEVNSLSSSSHMVRGTGFTPGVINIANITITTAGAMEIAVVRM